LVPQCVFTFLGQVTTGIWAVAALWFGLALIASLIAIIFRISTALSEIIVGALAQLILGAMIGPDVLGTAMAASHSRVISGR
jgi:hypothetical protein